MRRVSVSPPVPDLQTPVATPSTLDALELPSLLRMVAELAATDAGREQVLGLMPSRSAERLAAERQSYEEAAQLLEDGALVPVEERSLLDCWQRLGSGDAEFEGRDLLLLASMLRSTHAARERCRGAEPPCPRLTGAAEELEDLDGLRRRIQSTLDTRGRVRDEASPRLARLASSARRVRDGLYARLQEFNQSHGDEVAEDTVPLHGGRLVVKLRAGARAQSKGLVHGRSGTGKSVYFEPLEMVEENNRLQEARQQVDEERRRLLLELIEEAVERRPALGRHLEYLAFLDRLQAAARFGAACNARPAEVSDGAALELRGARHPLLDPALADLRRRALGTPGHTAPIVPVDLQLDGDHRVLVVTGPNAGGKTVTLKTIGLLALAGQCGLPVPVEAGSRLPILDRVVATVGDEQDLLEDRSTFSGRLLRLKEAWQAGGPGSLVLLDELGSGTDPEEGAALAIALVEGLADGGGLAVVTTHLSRLAAAALELGGAFCAAMEFDSATGAPTYHLTPGAPGGSEALSLARRLELPAAWLDRADALLGPEHRQLQRLLAEVEQVRSELAGERRRVAAEADRLEARRRDLEARSERLDGERRQLAKQVDRKLGEFQREVRSRLDREVERLRRELDRGRRKGLAAASVKRLFEEAPRVEAPPAAPELPIEVGGEVEHRGLGWRGTLERLDRSRAEVKVAGKRVRCKADELRGVAAGPAAAPRPRIRVSGDDEGTPRELQLIGRRVEPALEELDAYLDRALRSAHAEVRVVHGHGTGRLRDAVRKFLRGHPAVRSVRPGDESEGGNGATVVGLEE